MKFHYNDGGRSLYTNVASEHDCVVRAVAIAANLSYFEVYAKLRAISPDLESEGVNVRSIAFTDYMASLGFVRVEGITAMHVIPEGRIIACTAGHYTAIVNGTIQDVRNEAHKAVSHYWVMGKTFNLYRGEKKLNSNPMNASQALGMLRLYTLNYSGGVQLKTA